MGESWTPINEAMGVQVLAFQTWRRRSAVVANKMGWAEPLPDSQCILSFDKERARTRNPQCFRLWCSVGLSPSRGLLRHGFPKALLFGQYKSDMATEVWLHTGFCPAVRPISGSQLLESNAKIESLLLFEQSLQRQIALGDVAGIAWETGFVDESIVGLP